MVANSLTWWFQSLEIAQTSLYVWIYNIIWIYIKLIHIMWIHALGIHIYHMNSYIWIRFKQIPIFLTNVSCWSSVLCCLSLKIFSRGSLRVSSNIFSFSYSTQGKSAFDVHLDEWVLLWPQLHLCFYTWRLGSLLLRFWVNLYQRSHLWLGCWTCIPEH